MENFEEKYSKYITKLKNELPNILLKERNNFRFDFKSNFVNGNSFLSTIGILWWVCGFIVIPLLENKPIVYLIVSIVWIGIGVWYWIFKGRHTEDVSDYLFYKYEHKKIIENRIKRDEQREIQNLLNEIFEKDNLCFTDLDMYKFKIEDIKDFYDQCLSEITHEQFVKK